MEFGNSLNFADVEKGLRELNEDISFDASVRRPADYKPVLSVAASEMQDIRCGVYWNGKYVCAVDRGVIPEFKIWNVRTGWLEIPMSEIEKGETKVCWVEIPAHSEHYEAAKAMALKKDDNYAITEEGKVIRFQALRWQKIPDRVMRVGWRHTFEALLRNQIPGVTRDAIERKFKVDMKKVLVGGDQVDYERTLYEE